MKVLAFGDVQVHPYSADWSRPTASGRTELLDLCAATFEWLVEQVKEEDPDLLVCLGDVFETGDVVDVRALDVAKFGMQRLAAHARRRVLVTGNHGRYSKDPSITADVVFWPEWEIVLAPTGLVTADRIAYIPYADPALVQQWIRDLAPPVVVFGHYDVQGARLSATHVSDRGPTLRDGMGAVVGHHHHPEIVGRTTLVGAPFHRNWTDTRSETPRGAAVLEVVQGRIQSFRRLENPHTPFFETVRAPDLPGLKEALRGLADRERTHLRVVVPPSVAEDARTLAGTMGFRSVRVAVLRSRQDLAVPEERRGLGVLDLQPRKLVASHVLRTDTSLDRKTLIREGETLVDSAEA